MNYGHQQNKKKKNKLCRFCHCYFFDKDSISFCFSAKNEPDKNPTKSRQVLYHTEFQSEIEFFILIDFGCIPKDNKYIGENNEDHQDQGKLFPEL